MENLTVNFYILSALILILITLLGILAKKSIK